MNIHPKSARQSDLLGGSAFGGLGRIIHAALDDFTANLEHIFGLSFVLVFPILLSSHESVVCAYGRAADFELKFNQGKRHVRTVYWRNRDVQWEFPLHAIGLCVTGSCCPLHRTPRCFRFWGTTFGGNGQSNFQLPNMQGRSPVHPGNNGVTTYTLGEVSGSSNVTLLTSNLPAHTHPLTEASAKASVGARTDAPNPTVPSGNFLGAANAYVGGQSVKNSVLAAGSINFAAGGATNPTGSNVPFSVQNPFLCVNFIIALVGIFPSRN